MKKNKKIKIGICGGFDNSIINGQALRTISIANKIIEILGETNVLIVKYANWKKRVFSLLFEYINQIKKCESLIVCPDERAIKYIIPIARAFSPFFKTRVYYVVIGGWLPMFLKKHKHLKKQLQGINGLFVQTEILKKQLYDIGVTNVYILPNFRNYDNQNLKTSLPACTLPIKAFFLARIEDLKGVEEMVKVVERINDKEKKCSLDIFGSVMPEYREKFKFLMNDFPDYINYCGELKSENINAVISEYDLHLFPTKYKTEGFPGSILDAFYAGIPSLSANWLSGKEVINDMVDGVLFEQFNYDDMFDKLIMICNDISLLNKLKEGARIRATQYNGTTIIKNMLSIVCNNN